MNVAQRSNYLVSLGVDLLEHSKGIKKMASSAFVSDADIEVACKKIKEQVAEVITEFGRKLRSEAMKDRNSSFIVNKVPHVKNMGDAVKYTKFVVLRDGVSGLSGHGRSVKVHCAVDSKDVCDLINIDLETLAYSVSNFKEYMYGEIQPVSGGEQDQSSSGQRSPENIKQDCIKQYGESYGEFA